MADKPEPYTVLTLERWAPVDPWFAQTYMDFDDITKQILPIYRYTYTLLSGVETANMVRAKDEMDAYLKATKKLVKHRRGAETRRAKREQAQ